ncbi:MAG: prephenate dehydrogenase [Nitrospirae bacterium]|nr:prephenate dehydrogenase [Nitrospirota bacterium]
MFFSKVTIIGVGLIGGSLALSLKEKKLTAEICGWGRSEERLKAAKKRGIIDSYSLDITEAIKGADLIVLATPVDTFEGLATEITSSLSESPLITDVGSVKGELVYKLEEILSQKASYVGSHPIAGSDRSGVEHASSGLFRDATTVVTPTKTTDQASLDTIKKLWMALGSRVLILSPEEHDVMLSFISHLPHVVAYALVNTVCDYNPDFLRYTGGGFKDTTRIASSSETLWADICLYNRENLLKGIDMYIKQLELIKKALQDNDRDQLIEIFSKAKSNRLRLNEQ